MIKIDNIEYDVPVLKMSRNAEFLDKYAKRTASGGLIRKLIGVYYNYSLQFGFKSAEQYQALYAKLTEPVEFHTVTVYSEAGEYTFVAYVSNVADEIVHVNLNTSYIKCQGLTCNFIAREPARRP